MLSSEVNDDNLSTAACLYMVKRICRYDDQIRLFQRERLIEKNNMNGSFSYCHDSAERMKLGMGAASVVKINGPIMNRIKMKH